MLARYSNSPALRLRIGSSRIRNRLYLCLCFASVYALLLLHLDGYTGFALALALPTFVVLIRLYRPALPGSELCWRQGVWTLEDRQQIRVIAPGVRCTVLSWVIYLPFKALPGRLGVGESLWIFPDSVPSEHWRKLRLRLNLEARQSTQ